MKEFKFFSLVAAMVLAVIAALIPRVEIFPKYNEWVAFPVAWTSIFMVFLWGSASRLTSLMKTFHEKFDSTTGTFITGMFIIGVVSFVGILCYFATKPFFLALVGSEPIWMKFLIFLVGLPAVVALLIHLIEGKPKPEKD